MEKYIEPAAGKCTDGAAKNFSEDSALCERCDAKCCRYFALEIDEPDSEEEFDNLRWYLCHKDTVLYIEDGSWHLHIDNECRFLSDDNSCEIYEARPQMCRDHEAKDCEYCQPWSYDLKFTAPEELEIYMKNEFKK
ncbi:MAG: YkgJ family cysteine cluster protein [Planctomycetota bacterium]|jgi:Fe-S-cluster containining protein